MSVSPPIIDAHVSLGEEHYLRLTSAELIADMDSHAITMAIARPMGAELAVHFARGNDRCLSASPRVRALATANPWADNAADELRRCRDRGAVGLYLHPTRQGFMPTDPVAVPPLELASEFSWPVVFHTGTYIQSDVLAVAEVARRFPQTQFLCDTAGFADMWFELPGLLGDLGNLHLIASLIWPRAIANTIKNYGAQRILFGSGSPRDTVAAALQRIDRVDLSPSNRAAILHDNAARIFKLPRDPA